MTVRLPATLTERIDEHAKSFGESRSETMRRLLEEALPASSPPKPKRASRKHEG